MREIKFRAWHKTDKVMVDVLAIDWRLKQIAYDNKTDWDFAVDPDWEPGKLKNWELMQYTGLKDKNGVEIYEGDILAFGSHETNSYGTSLIKWSEGAARFYQVPSMAPDVIDWRGCEVIGNIYENPELSKDSL